MSHEIDAGNGLALLTGIMTAITVMPSGEREDTVASLIVPASRREITSALLASACLLSGAIGELTGGNVIEWLAEQGRVAVELRGES